MAVATLLPDAIITQANLSGTVSSLADDPGTPGNDWLTAVDNNTDSNLIVSFGSPDGSPNTGAGLQTFRFWVRCTANGSAVTYDIYLANSAGRLNGGAAIQNGTITSTTGELLTATWDASLLTAGDGSDVRAEIYFTKTGGSPTARTTGEVDAVAWDVDYTAVTNQTITGAVFTEADTFGTSQVNLLLSGAIFTEADTFGAGQIDLSFNIGGVIFTEDDVFQTGTVLIEQFIDGVIFTEADTFGTHQVGLTLFGAILTEADTFGVGSIAAPEPAYLRPDADDTNGGWVNELGQSTNLWQSIDEVTPSDVDYVESPINPAGEVLKVRLSNPLGVDGAYPNKLTYRYGKKYDSKTIDMTFRLMEGVVEIASWNHNDVPVGFQTVTQTLTAPQQAAITDYSNLFVQVEATTL